MKQTCRYQARRAGDYGGTGAGRTLSDFVRLTSETGRCPVLYSHTCTEHQYLKAGAPRRQR